MYEGINNLNQLASGLPLDAASTAELAAALRETRLILKTVLLQSLRPNGVLRSIGADSIGNGVVGEAQLLDGSITTAKLVALAITSELLANASVTTGKIEDGAVTANKLAAGSVGTAAYASESIPLTALAVALTESYISKSATDDSLRAIVGDHIKDLTIPDRCLVALAVEKLSGGTAGQILVRGETNYEAVTPAGGLTYNTETNQFEIASSAFGAYFGDMKARGADGGSTLANTWVTRDLGEIEDGQNLMTFVGNSFKLVPGSYIFEAKCPVAGAVGRHQARLFRDNGDSTNIIAVWGTSETNAAGQSGASIVRGVLIVDNADHLYKLEHWTQNAVASTGFGLAANSDNAIVYGDHSEVYTVGTLIKFK